jgi:Zn-dependent protease
MPIDALFFIAILIMSVVIHEVAHGYAADMLGDPTARFERRLTLNPLPHLDLVGSVLVPLLLLFSNAGFLIGWAKPVPYNPYNLRNQRWGTLIVAGAGVLTNIVIALLFGLLIRFSGVSAEAMLVEPFWRLATIIVGLNLVLGIFNLIPVPPLDGSKVLFSLLPYRFMHIERFLEQYWFVLIILVFFFGSSIVLPLLSLAFTVITGLPIGVYALALPF